MAAVADIAVEMIVGPEYVTGWFLAHEVGHRPEDDSPT
jgi:hypothetical protein